MIKVFYETSHKYLWVDRYYVNSVGNTIRLQDTGRIREREEDGDKFDVLPKELLT